ncbi:MAG: hypothetical protein WCI31_01300 [Prolixibacteraceae bacterium]
MRFVFRIVFIICILSISLPGKSQISPGELSKVHAHLEGMSNCTQCHTLGAKVSNEKCLDCHKEVKKRLNETRGYHASSKVKSKECIICHSEHYGRNYDIVHLIKDKFDHNETGYKLEGKHAKKECADCHKIANISDPQLKNKHETFLGLSESCLPCHEDFHQKTLPVNCLNCHNYDAFKPATKFDHAKTKYQLKGKHIDVACEKCHPKSSRNGKNFQQFSGLQFQNCVACHKDPHENKFGQNCMQCHVEESFKSVKSIGQFDHSKTGFELIGKHIQVACKTCHKTNLTAAIKHEKCTDCHKDYHKNQFSKAGKSPDCSECHDVTGFVQFSYSVEKHNLSKFKLEGAHLAIPCLDCHKKEKEWNFKNIGERCVDCHKDIHKDLIDTKYYPVQKCENCHQVLAWNEIKFDHKLTSFDLQGKHAATSCRKCHFDEKINKGMSQKFKGFDGNCESCHTDVHRAQFSKNNEIVCLKCHGFNNWKPEKFNHNTTRFKLDGGHKDVACAKCHKLLTEGNNTYINYKFKDILCATCHLQ